MESSRVILIPSTIVTEFFIHTLESRLCELLKTETTFYLFSAFIVHHIEDIQWTIDYEHIVEEVK